MSLLRVFYAPIFTGLDDNGFPVPGGKLYTYAAGTTTPLATFTDAGGGTARTNPIVLDANGRAIVFLGNTVYKFVLQDANGVTLWEVDQVSGINTVSAGDISGTISLSQLPSIPLSKITVDVNPGSKFFYQTVQFTGATQAQRPTLNVLAPLTVDDNATIPATEIGLAASGVTAGAYTSANITVDGYGRLTAASNGGSSFPSRVDDANGSSLTLPDGTKFKWGQSSPIPTGTVFKGTVSVTFPGGAFTAIPVVNVTADNCPDASNNDPIECYARNITVNGFIMVYTCPTLIGGSGANSISNVVHGNWEAKGH